MTKWVKFFTDNTKEIGTDKDIEISLASWSKGRLDNIYKVELYEGIKCGILSIPDTDYFQFDRFVTSVGIGKQTSDRAFRAIQAKINSKHIGKYLIVTTSSKRIECVLQSKKPESSNIYFKEITKSHVGKWISVIIPKNNVAYIAMSSKKGTL